MIIICVVGRVTMIIICVVGRVTMNKNSTLLVGKHSLQILLCALWPLTLRT